MCVDSNSSASIVTDVIPRGERVGGVTSFGDDVSVLCSRSQQQVQVYDEKSFTLQRHITVPGRVVASPDNNYVYASDSENSIYRVELTLRSATAAYTE